MRAPDLTPALVRCTRTLASFLWLRLLDMDLWLRVPIVQSMSQHSQLAFDYKVFILVWQALCTAETSVSLSSDASGGERNTENADAVSASRPGRGRGR